MHHPTSVTIGMDVSDKYCHVVVLDDGGTVVRRDRIATRASALERWFEPYAGQRVVMEVGPQSPWMSRLLGSKVELIVANPTKVALISGGHTKNDSLDAEKLARLGRADPSLLSPVKHRRADTQASLALVKARHALVRSRTLLINSVRGQAKAAGVNMTKGSSSTFHRRVAEIPELVDDALAPLMEMIASLTEKITDYDRVIRELCEEVYPETAPLLEIKGVGPQTALQFVLVIEEPARFPSSRAVGSYLGLRPRQDQSGDTDRQLRITKAGDPLMRRNLVQCAHRILDPRYPDTDLQRWGLKLLGRGGKAARKRAVVSVARKLAILMHRLLVTGEAYVPNRQAA